MARRFSKPLGPRARRAAELIGSIVRALVGPRLVLVPVPVRRSAGRGGGRA